MIKDKTEPIIEIYEGTEEIGSVYVGKTLVWPEYNFKGTFEPGFIPSVKVFLQSCIWLEIDESNNFKAFMDPEPIHLNGRFSNCKFKEITELPDFIRVDSASNILAGVTAKHSDILAIVKKIESASNINNALYGITCSDSTTLDLSTVCFNSVKSMDSTFTYLNVEKLIFPSITYNGEISMFYTFKENHSLKEIDFNGFTARTVTTLNCAFLNSTGLITLDLSTFNLISCENFNATFSGCKNLTHIKPPQTPSDKVATISQMFYNCKSLQEIDLSKFVSPDAYITQMDRTFYGCQKLTKIIMPECFASGRQVTMTNAFYNCRELKEIEGPFPTPSGDFYITMNEDFTEASLDKIIEALERNKGTNSEPYKIYMTSKYVEKIPEAKKQRIEAANWSIEKN